MPFRFLNPREGDDYTEILKGRCTLFIIFGVLGFATLGGSLSLAMFDVLDASLSYAIGFYTLLVSAAVFFVSFRSSRACFAKKL